MLFFLSTLYTLTSLSPSPVRKATLTVEVQHIQDLRGQVQIGLFASATGFPGKAKPVQAKSVKASHNTVEAVFEVEPGTYALAVYHDVNGNGKIDKKLFGIPIEPYGFSNNVRPRFSSPSFNDCKVRVGEGGKAISIQVK